MKISPPSPVVEQPSNLAADKTEQLYDRPYEKIFPELYDEKFLTENKNINEALMFSKATEAFMRYPKDFRLAREDFINKITTYTPKEIKKYIDYSLTGQRIDYSPRKVEKKNGGGFVESNTDLTTDERNLQKKEYQYYKDNPRSSLRLVPLEEVTKYGMPVYVDQHGMRHSESSTTFNIEIDGTEKWVTVPTIWPGENQPTISKEKTGKYWTPEKLFPFINKHISKNKKSFINPITKEETPLFNSREEAEKFAVQRDMSLQEKKKKEGGFVSA